MLTNLDKSILNILQREFIITENPYQEIAEKLDITEEELINRISDLKDKGIIRRIGAVLDSKSLGFYSTLCAAIVPDNKLDKIVNSINKQEGVTHNYIREHEYNVWFTLTTPSYEEAACILEDLEQESGIRIVSMPAKAVYKIKVSFEMEEADAI